MGLGPEPVKALTRRCSRLLARIKGDRELQKRGLAALIALCIGAGLGEVSRRYGLQKEAMEEAAAAALALQTEETKALETAPLEEDKGTKVSTPAEAAETEPEEKPYEPSPDRLNLAYYFPEDSDGEDIIDSYAGQVFKEMTIRDSEWLADIYELADIRPAAMAARLGRDPSSVIGKYDPENEGHDPDMPSTWSVDNWKKIHVSFVDGDGRTSTSYSNVKEILAMASVYTYHTDLMDVEAFKAYATRLWEDSHSYSLSMGNVYYCDGCIDKTDEEIAQEAILEEEGAAAALAAREEGDPSENGEGTKAAGQQGTTEGDGQTDSSSSGKTDSSSSGKTDSSTAGKTDSSSSGKTDSRASGESSSPPASEAGQSVGTSGAPAGAGTDSAVSAEAAEASGGDDGQERSGQQVTVIRRTKKRTEETEQADDAQGAETDTAAQESIVAGHGGEEAGAPTVIRRTKKDLETAESLEGGLLASDTDAQPAALALSGDDMAASVLQDSSPGTDGWADGGGADGQTAADSDHDRRENRGSGGQESGGDEGSDALDGQGPRKRRPDCPGHVDLYIRVKLLGLEGKNGLLARDKIGNAVNSDKAAAAGGSSKEKDKGTGEEQSKGAGEEAPPAWEGWTETNIAHVRRICEQDWFADYGLSISSISLSTPLSAAEIQDYMDQLPEGLSETRREIVRFALSSVGHVPYYWGGKASHPGYEGNDFGILVPSDDKGRILKGLDCSGWISWVYWSVTGERLEGSSTSGLILCGEKISRSELKPGDIIVRTGTNAHVVMFLSWSANGQMNVIHESSASVNNVTIKTMDAAWPYYRRLVD